MNAAEEYLASTIPTLRSEVKRLKEELYNTQKDNARLSCRVKELEEACKAVMAWANGRDWEFVKIVRSAISKEGGSL